MAQQILNVSIPNSGFGDALRDASIKSNDNFTELYEGKVDKVTGKDLSDNNLTDELVTKINDLEANAQVNIQSDWNENDIEADAYIKNKPDQLFASLGYFDYADLATQTTPITVTSGVQTLLTNDTLGDATNTSQPPYGVNAVWDADSEEFNFSQLSVGDTVDIRVHLKTTTTTANQKYHIDIKFAFDGPSEFENRIFSQYVKTAGEDEQSFVTSLYIGSEDVKNYPAKIYITSDNNATVKVVGWFCRVFRKSVNIVDFEDPANLISTDPDNAIELGTDGKLWSGGGSGGSVPDATETVKGKAQIATEAETISGVNDTKIVTPSKLKAVRDLLENLIGDKQDALLYTPANKAGETFSGNITAPNLSGTNTGDETLSSIQSKLVSTSNLIEGTNLYFTTARVLATVLTGISFATGGAIVSTDTVLVAFGKIQKQINDLSSSLSSYVQTSRTINSKALSSDIVLTAADIGYNQVIINSSTTAQASWNGKVVKVRGNLTITIPASGLPSGYTFEFIVDPTYTLSWAIVTKTWVFGTPSTNGPGTMGTILQDEQDDTKIYLMT